MKQKARKKENNKMQIFNGKSKGKTTAIILTLLMTCVMLFAVAPSPANAQLASTGSPTYTPWQTSVPTGSTPSVTIATEAFMSISPNPIGLGQPFLINMA
jgi:hypothetical protein